MTRYEELMDTARIYTVRQRIRSAGGWFLLGFLLAAAFVRWGQERELRTQNIQAVIEPVMAAERIRQHQERIKQTTRPIVIIRDEAKQQKGSDK